MEGPYIPRVCSSYQSSETQRALEKRREKSRDAARSRRTRENQQFVELAKLLPLSDAVTSSLDRATVIKLTVGFLKYQELYSTLQPSDDKKAANDTTGLDDNDDFHIFGSPIRFEKELGLNLMKALDGFIICISQEGKCMYVSETMSTYLGLAQLDLIGDSIYKNVHPDDQKELSELLGSGNPLVNSLFEDILNADCIDEETIVSEARKAKSDDVSCFIRMKCTLMRRGRTYLKSCYKVMHLSGRLVRYRSKEKGKLETLYALVAVAKPLPSPSICELKLETKVFVSRVGLDLCITFSEGKIRKYMDLTAKNIVGQNAYEFYHLDDMHVVQDAHAICVRKGQVMTEPYRWMNKNGGWVWMQTMASIIKRNTIHGEQAQILCINYILTGLESADEKLARVGNPQQQVVATPVPSSSNYTTDKDMQDYEICVPMNKAKRPPPQPVQQTPQMPIRYQEIATNDMQNSGYSHHPYQRNYPEARRQRFSSSGFPSSCVDQNSRGYVENMPTFSSRYPLSMAGISEQESPVSFPAEMDGRSCEDVKLGSFDLPDVVPDQSYGTYWNRRSNQSYNRQPGISETMSNSTMVSPNSTGYQDWRPHHQQVSSDDYNQSFYQTSPHASGNFHATFSY